MVKLYKGRPLKHYFMFVVCVMVCAALAALAPYVYQKIADSNAYDWYKSLALFISTVYGAMFMIILVIVVSDEIRRICNYNSTKDQDF